MCVRACVRACIPEFHCSGLVLWQCPGDTDPWCSVICCVAVAASFDLLSSLNILLFGLPTWKGGFRSDLHKPLSFVRTRAAVPRFSGEE